MDKNTSLLAAIASDAVAVKKNLKISRRSGFSSRLRDEMAFRIVCSRGIVSATLPSDPALACLKLSDAPPYSADSPTEENSASRARALFPPLEDAHRSW